MDEATIILAGGLAQATKKSAPRPTKGHRRAYKRRPGEVNCSRTSWARRLQRARAVCMQIAAASRNTSAARRASGVWSGSDPSYPGRWGSKQARGHRKIVDGRNSFYGGCDGRSRSAIPRSRRPTSGGIAKMGGNISIARFVRFKRGDRPDRILRTANATRKANHELYSQTCPTCLPRVPQASTRSSGEQAFGIDPAVRRREPKRSAKSHIACRRRRHRRGTSPRARGQRDGDDRATADYMAWSRTVITARAADALNTTRAHRVRAPSNARRAEPLTGAGPASPGKGTGVIFRRHGIHTSRPTRGGTAPMEMMRRHLKGTKVTASTRRHDDRSERHEFDTSPTSRSAEGLKVIDAPRSALHDNKLR